MKNNWTLKAKHKPKLSRSSSITKQNDKRALQRQRKQINFFKKHSSFVERSYENKLQVVCKQKTWLNLARSTESERKRRTYRIGKYFKFSVTNFALISHFSFFLVVLLLLLMAKMGCYKCTWELRNFGFMTLRLKINVVFF